MHLSGVLALIFSALNFAACRIRPPYCKPSQPNSKPPEQFFWKIQRDPPAYFFGTIHMPYVEVWDYLGKEVKSAFYQSQNVIMELDLSDFYTLKLLHKCRLLPDGRNLGDVLPSDIYKRLKEHISYIKLRMPSWLGSDDPVHARAHATYIFERIAGNWEMRRPIWAMLMLNSLTEEAVTQFGSATLDSYLIQEAKRRSQNVGAIEYVKEHCDALNSLTLSQAIFALNLTLTMHEHLRWGTGGGEELSARAELIRHYNCGTLDEEVFDKEILNVLETSASDQATKTRAKNIDSYFKKELVYKRNLRMAERVLRVLESEPNQSFFFAFGTGHFFGDDSVINLVRKAGLSVEPVFPDYGKKRQRHRHRKPSNFKDSDTDSNNWEWASVRKPRVQSDSNANHVTAEPRKRIFNSLWVPIKDYSPRPWQEIIVEAFTPESAASKVNFNVYDSSVYGIENSASGLKSSFANRVPLMTTFVAIAVFLSLLGAGYSVLDVFLLLILTVLDFRKLLIRV